MIKKQKLALIILIIIILINLGCKKDMKLKDTTIYYNSFTGYSHPIKPVEQISREKALAQIAYCIAYYDENGNVEKFEKYLHGKLFFQYLYEYHESGKIKQCRITNEEGSENFFYYDINGKLTK